jgi:transposase
MLMEPGQAVFVVVCNCRGAWMEGTLEPGRGLGKHRCWTMEEKRRMVEETLSSSASVATVARQHGLNANQLFYWRKLYHGGQLGPSSHVGGSAGVRLLPVAVTDDAAQGAQAVVAEKRLTGTINIEFPGLALVSVEGHVDSGVVRAVLESLRG